MKIIIPTDFSENAYRAIVYVFNHFITSQVEITLVHTIERPSSSRVMMVRIDDIMQTDAEQAMRKVLTRVRNEFGKTPQYIIRHGHLKDWIEQVADITEPDIIVMSTKGENNIASKLMGSVTESIIRTSRFPVLAVPGDNNSSEIRDITIASPTNQVEKNSFIQSWIKKIKSKQLRISLLRVINNDSELVPRSISFAGREIAVEIVRSEGVVKGINTYVQNHHTDILILVHSHKSRIDYLFNRSVTKSICARVQLPLLVIPC